MTKADEQRVRELIVEALDARDKQMAAAFLDDLTMYNDRIAALLAQYPTRAVD